MEDDGGQTHLVFNKWVLFLLTQIIALANWYTCR